MTVHKSLTPLENFDTKVLKQFLDSARACGGQYCPLDYGPCYQFDDIKSVLDTREHLPNKKERKSIRQAAAKRGS